jgi:tagatose-6-phosphate ketose/aldose isomerase
MLLAVLLAFRGEDPAAIDALAAGAEQLIAHQERIAALAAPVPQRLVYLGGGPLTGLARESALKLLELTAGRVVAYFDSPLGFRHGPKAVLDRHSVAVVYRSADPYSSAYDEDIVRELRASIGHDRVLTVSAVPGASGGARGGAADWVLEGLEALDDAYLAVAYVVFAQLLALYCSAALGLKPDNPFPDGDVNRVVKGVIIHPLTVDAHTATRATERRP